MVESISKKCALHTISPDLQENLSQENQHSLDQWGKRKIQEILRYLLHSEMNLSQEKEKYLHENGKTSNQ
jgi:fructose-1,6-bisphosphatase